MRKITKAVIIVLILVLTVVFISFDISGIVFTNSSSEYYHSWTKAVCNGTHCQDYLIECNGDEVIGFSPITGAVIVIPSGWEDPRNETMRERTCEKY